jgi:hypothetical protein
MDSQAYKTRVVRTYLTTQLGGPIVEALDEDVNAVQTAINVALVNYWAAFPYTFRDTFNTPMRGSLGFSEDEILTRVFPDVPIRDNAYFLGVSRVDDNPSSVWGSNINSYLLGVPFVYPGAYNDLPYPYSSGVDLASMVRTATEANVITGEVEIEFDPSGRISFLTPNAWTQLTVWFAFGFNEKVGLRFIPNSMIDFFRKLAAIEYLSIVLNARSQVSVQSDFTINVQQIAMRRDELKREITQMMNELHTPAIMWG